MNPQQTGSGYSVPTTTQPFEAGPEEGFVRTQHACSTWDGNGRFFVDPFNNPYEIKLPHYMPLRDCGGNPMTNRFEPSL